MEDQVTEETSKCPWSKYKTALTETADKILGELKRYSKDPWISNEVLNLSEKKNKLRTLRSSPAQDQRYNDLRSEIQRKLRKDMAIWPENQCQKIGEFDTMGKSKTVYGMIKSVKMTTPGHHSRRVWKTEDGIVLEQKRNTLNRWNGYGVQVFEKPKEGEPLVEDQIFPDEQEPPPLLSEIEHAVKKTSTGKSPGLDGIPAELVKAIGPAGIKLLHNLYVNIYEKAVIGQKTGKSRSLLFYLRLEIENSAQTIDYSIDQPQQNPDVNSSWPS